MLWSNIKLWSSIKFTTFTTFTIKIKMKKDKKPLKKEEYLSLNIDSSKEYFKVSDKSLNLIGQLDDFSIKNNSDQELFFNKTSELTNSIFQDKTIYNLSENFKDTQSILDLPDIENPLVIPRGSEEILTITNPEVIKWGDEQGIFLTTKNLTNTLETGLASQGLENIAKFEATKDISLIDFEVNTEEKSVVPKQPEGLVETIGKTFLDTKQYFATEHTPAIYERALILLESHIEQTKITNKESKRANDLKEEEIKLIKENNKEIKVLISSVKDELKTILATTKLSSTNKKNAEKSESSEVFFDTKGQRLVVKRNNKHSNQIKGVQKKMLNMFLSNKCMYCTKARLDKSFPGTDRMTSTKTRLKNSLEPIAIIVANKDTDNSTITTGYWIVLKEN